MTDEIINEPLEEAAVIPPDTVKTRDRITCRLMFHHEHWGDAPHPVNIAYQALLDNKEQPYRRQVVATSEPQAIDVGWTKNPGTIFIENKAGANKVVHLTEEQALTLKQSILAVYFNGQTDAMIIRPGRFLMVEVTRPSELRIQALNDTTIPVTLNVFSN